MFEIFPSKKWITDIDRHVDQKIIVIKSGHIIWRLEANMTKLNSSYDLKRVTCT